VDLKTPFTLAAQSGVFDDATPVLTLASFTLKTERYGETGVSHSPAGRFCVVFCGVLTDLKILRTEEEQEFESTDVSHDSLFPR
jgi:hypothetical protein